MAYNIYKNNLLKLNYKRENVLIQLCNWLVFDSYGKYILFHNNYVIKLITYNFFFFFLMTPLRSGQIVFYIILS